MLESHSDDTKLCDKVCEWLTAGLWFSLGTPVSSTNKSDRHDITEILLKVALNTLNQTINLLYMYLFLLCIAVDKINLILTRNKLSTHADPTTNED